MSSMSGKETVGQKPPFLSVWRISGVGDQVNLGRKVVVQSVWRISVGRKGRKQVVRDLLLSVSIYLTDDSMLWFMV